MDEKYIQELYNQLGGKNKFGDYKDFQGLITTNTDYQKAFHKEIGDKVLGNFNDFSTLVKKKEPTQPTSKISSSGVQTQEPIPTQSQLKGDNEHPIPIKDVSVAKRDVETWGTKNDNTFGVAATPPMRGADQSFKEKWFKERLPKMDNQTLMDAYVSFGTDNDYFGKMGDYSPIAQEVNKRIQQGQIKTPHTNANDYLQSFVDKKVKANPQQPFQETLATYNTESKKNIRKELGNAVEEWQQKSRIEKEQNKQKTGNWKRDNLVPATSANLPKDEVSVNGSEFEVKSNKPNYAEKMADIAINEFAKKNNIPKEDIHFDPKEKKYYYINRPNSIESDSQIKEIVYDKETGQMHKKGDFTDMFGQALVQNLDNVKNSMALSATQAEYQNGDIDYKQFKNKAFYLAKKAAEEEAKQPTYAAGEWGENFTGNLGEGLGGLAPYTTPYTAIPTMSFSDVSNNAKKILADPNLTDEQKSEAIAKSISQSEQTGMATASIFELSKLADVLKGSQALSKYAPLQKEVNSQLNSAKTILGDYAKGSSFLGGVMGTQEAANVNTLSSLGVKTDNSTIGEAALGGLKMGMLFNAPKLISFGLNKIINARKSGEDKANPSWFNKYNEAVNNQLIDIVEQPREVYNQSLVQLDKMPDTKAVRMSKAKIKQAKEFYDTLPIDLSKDQKRKAMHLLQLKEDATTTANEIKTKATESGNTSLESVATMYDERAKQYDKMLQKLITEPKEELQQEFIIDGKSVDEETFKKAMADGSLKNKQWHVKNSKLVDEAINKFGGEYDKETNTAISTTPRPKTKSEQETQEPTTKGNESIGVSTTNVTTEEISPTKEVIGETIQPTEEVKVEEPNVEFKNEGVADKPTDENVRERTGINHQFAKNVLSNLKKLGVVADDYILGGINQALGEGGKDGIASGDMYFKNDGTIKFITDKGIIEFDKDGNVISTKLESAKVRTKQDVQKDIDDTNKQISKYEAIKDSEDFKQKDALTTDPLGRKIKTKRAKTAEELKESTDKINKAISDLKNKVAEHEKELDTVPDAETTSKPIVEEPNVSEIITPKGFTNRVFEKNTQLGEAPKDAHISEEGYNYRTLSQKEIEAIQESGGVFSRDGKQKGGNSNTKYWTKGNGENWYGDKANQETIRVKQDNFKDNEVVKAENVEVYNKDTKKFEPLVKEQNTNEVVGDSRDILNDENKIDEVLKNRQTQIHNGELKTNEGLSLGVDTQDTGIESNGLETLTTKKWGHGSTRESQKGSLKILTNLLDGGQMQGDFGIISRGGKSEAYDAWEHGKFIITTDNPKYIYGTNGEGSYKLDPKYVEIILNDRLSAFGQDLANKHPEFIIKDYNGKRFEPTKNEVVETPKAETKATPIVEEQKIEGEKVVTKPIISEEPPLPKGETIVTPNGLTESERQVLIEKRKKSTAITEQEKTENGLAALTKKRNEKNALPTDKRNIDSKISQLVRKLNAEAGYEKYRYSNGVIGKRTKVRTGSIKGSTRYKTLSEVNRDANNGSIKEDAVVFTERPKNVRDTYDTLLDSDTIQYLHIMDASGKKAMSKEQIKSAIEDIENGIPSVGADTLLNTIEQATKDGNLPVIESGFKTSIPLEDALNVKKEVIGEPFSEENLMNWLNEESQNLTPEHQEILDNELNNIIYEYEQGGIEIEIPKSNTTAETTSSKIVEPKVSDATVNEKASQEVTNVFTESDNPSREGKSKKALIDARKEVFEKYKEKYGEDVKEKVKDINSNFEKYTKALKEVGEIIKIEC